MKNILKFTLTIMIASVTLYSCSDNETIEPIIEMTQAESSAFFKKNMSIFDARVRTLNETSFVKELYLANFSDKSWDRNEIGFENIVFQDNGEGNDLVANDGIFTSIDEFNFNEKISYNKNIEILSVMNTSIVSPEFRYLDKLNDLKLKYKIKKYWSVDDSFTTSKDPVGTITCDVEICSSGCIADWIWDGFGCICVSNCSVTIGFN